MAGAVGSPSKILVKRIFIGVFLEVSLFWEDL